MRKLAILALVAQLAGCGAPPARPALDLSKVDIGPPPVEFEESIRAYLSRALKDPESMINFSVGYPAKAACASGRDTRFFGWVVPAQYNAKNSYGGYVGSRMHYYWFRGEKLMGVTEATNICPDGEYWKRLL